MQGQRSELLVFECVNKLLEIIASAEVETIFVLKCASKINLRWLYTLV